MVNQLVHRIKAVLKNNSIRICILFVFISSCRSIDVDEVKQKSWKYVGYDIEISEFIQFGNDKNNEFYLDSNWDVSYKGKYVGTIISVSSSRMTIQTPKGESCYKSI